MDRIKSDPDQRSGSVLGHVIPRRRFTRWAAYYFVLYLVLPVMALGLLADLLLYAISSILLGRCYALFCFFV